jgi:hypothetical protein
MIHYQNSFINAFAITPLRKIVTSLIQKRLSLLLLVTVASKSSLIKRDALVVIVKHLIKKGKIIFALIVATLKNALDVINYLIKIMDISFALIGVS